MQLHGLLTDKAPRLPDVCFRARYRAAALGDILHIDVYGRNDGHRASLLGGDDHLRHAVLQRLKRADRHAELFAGLQIVERRLVQRRDDTQGLGAQRGNRAIHRPFDGEPGLCTAPITASARETFDEL